MQVYDGKSSVKWFYDGLMTFEQMRADSRKRLLTEAPCVLIDDGQGTAYDYRTIQSMCAEYGVEYTGDSETDMAAISDKIANPDPTPDVLAYQAKQTADEAKQIAEQAGTDPQVAVVARLTAQSIDFAEVSATDVVVIPDYIPEWSTLIGKQLKQNDPVKYDGTTYRCSQNVTVQDIYSPDVAGESQYYPIQVAPDGIIVYRSAHGKYDSVRIGETRHYPDADSPVYRSLVDWNAYAPDVRPDDWELVTE